MVGLYEALSGRFMTSLGTVTTTGNALRIDRGELFELMADNIPLLQGIFSGLLHASPAAPRGGRARACRHLAAASGQFHYAGSRISKLVVTPGVLDTRTVPPCRSTIAFTIDSPSPVPAPPVLDGSAL